MQPFFIPQKAARGLTPASCFFLLALVVRLLVLFRAADSLEFQPTHGDMQFYHEWALRITRGAWTDGHAFYGLPLYAYLVAGIYGLFGALPYLAVLPQAGAEALTTVLIYRLGVDAFTGKTENAGNAGPVIGGAAALGWVFFVPAQAFAVVLMPTSYLVLAFWFIVWWIVRPRVSQPGGRECLALGATMGFMAMMVANVLSLLPLVGLALWRRWPVSKGGSSPSEIIPRHAGAKTLVTMACVAAGVLVGTAPCWMHNRFIAGEPVFLSAHGGINFFIGNNPQANGYPRIPDGMHADQAGLLRDSVLVAERAAGRPLTRVEVSAYWSGRAREFIRQQPFDWLLLVGRKLRNFWSDFQYDDLSAIAGFREEGVTLPGLRFGMVALLALPGAAAAWARWPRARWIVGGVGLHMISVLTVFVTERYRLAAVPGLLLLGAAGVWEGIRVWRERRMGSLAAYATALLGAAALVFWPPAAGLKPPDDFNTGLADLEAGRLDRAQAKLERAWSEMPTGAEQNFALGNLWLARGERDRAKGYYRRTLQLDPGHDAVLNNLGILALEENRPETAVIFLERSLQTRPDSAHTLYLLASARLQCGEFPAALTAINTALRLEPGRADFTALRERLVTRNTTAN